MLNSFLVNETRNFQAKLWFHFLERKEFFKDMTILVSHFEYFFFHHFENVMRKERELAFTEDLLSARQFFHMHYLI